MHPNTSRRYREEGFVRLGKVWIVDCLLEDADAAHRTHVLGVVIVVVHALRIFGAQPARGAPAPTVKLQLGATLA
jgi:hypothetical protein